MGFAYFLQLIENLKWFWVQVFLYHVPDGGLMRWDNIYREDDLLDPVILPDILDSEGNLALDIEAPVTSTGSNQLTFDIPSITTGYYWPILWSEKWGAADYGQLSDSALSIFVPAAIAQAGPAGALSTPMPPQGGFVEILGAGFPAGLDLDQIELEGVTPFVTYTLCVVHAYCLNDVECSAWACIVLVHIGFDVNKHGFDVNKHCEL